MTPVAVDGDGLLIARVPAMVIELLLRRVNIRRESRRRSPVHA